MQDSSERLGENMYFPELKRNLNSLSELEKLGYYFQGNKGVMKVVKGSLVVMIDVRSIGVYSQIRDRLIRTIKTVSGKSVGQRAREHLRHRQSKEI